MRLISTLMGKGEKPVSRKVEPKEIKYTSEQISSIVRQIISEYLEPDDSFCGIKPEQRLTDLALDSLDVCGIMNDIENRLNISFTDVIDKNYTVSDIIKLSESEIELLNRLAPPPHRSPAA